MSDVMTVETLLTLLKSALVSNESLTFTIMPHPEGMALLTEAALRKKVDVPKETEGVRAALGLPLRRVGSPALLAAELTAKLQGFAEARHEAFDSYSALLNSINEASKEAKVKTTQAGKTPVGKKVPRPAADTPAAASTPPAPATRAASADATASAASSAPAPSSSAPTDANSRDSGVMQPVSLL
jgi:hypothetical protein